ncbi:MAG TPA: DNA polymerase/3'-5' exonuclease PolX [Tepidisphaeraceae bacterium]|nr:DNA polymerase/3'-5' exonuclease PolX [Tepidisphaeraceae bacterium]
MPLNDELSELFRKFAAILELRGEPVFKAISFSRVSRLMKDATFDVKKAVEDGALGDIDGIGPSSKRIIEEFVRTGKSSDFDELSASVPPGLLPLLDIPGAGPKTIALFWKERNITNIEELTKAIEEGKLAGLKGIGEKKIEAIKQGIALRSQAAGRMGIAEALPIAEALVQRLRDLPGVAQVEIAGSLRRRRETIGDVDLLCSVKSAASAESVAQAFTQFPEVTRILGCGATKSSVITAGGLQVDLRIVPQVNFGAALQYFTGSKDHNTRLRGLAQDKKMTLNEWGLYRLDEYDRAKKKTGQPPETKPVASKTEKEIYAALGLDWIDPLLREDCGEIAAAAEGKLPRLIEASDIRGDLHCHTTASDGKASILEMAQAAKNRGYEFLAITDHSKSQTIANGLTAQRLLKHAADIRKANGKIPGITLLAGCEVDILVDGKLDFEESVLAELDFVVASPHVSLKQDQEKATGRLLRAIDTRYVNVIGHPTGRLINSRAGLPLDFASIFRAAASTGTALEINAGYPRLDLNDTQARAAAIAGVMISINTDAHSPAGLDELQLGIDVARRAWLTPKNVINCMTLADLKTFIQRKR